MERYVYFWQKFLKNKKLFLKLNMIKDKMIL